MCQSRPLTKCNGYNAAYLSLEDEGAIFGWEQGKQNDSWIVKAAGDNFKHLGKTDTYCGRQQAS